MLVACMVVVSLISATHSTSLEESAMNLLQSLTSSMHHSERGRHILLHEDHINTNKASEFHSCDSHDLARKAHGDEEKLEYYLSMTDVNPTTRKETEEDMGMRFSAYIPHNTFIVRLTQEEAENAKRARNVHWVGFRKPEHKVAPVVQKTGEDHTAEWFSSRELVVMLSQDEVWSDAEMKTHANNLCKTINENGIASSCAPGGRNILVVNVHDGEKNFQNTIQAARITSEYPAVHWVENLAKIKPQNDVARQLIEDRTDPVGNPDGNLISNIDPPLRGNGQVVGLGDSGIDWDNCFFNDEDTSVPFNTVNGNHRKIRMYDTEWGNRLDDLLHGTHMAGTLVGKIPASANFNPVKWDFDRDTYQGVVSEAKIAFVDLNNGTQNYNVPTDMMSMYRKTLNAGAFVNAYGWGVAADFYSNLDYFTDQFAWENRDYLTVFAIGNQENAIKFLKPLSPATAKSSIAVGSSFSSLRTFVREDGLTGKEYENYHRFWFRQMCGVDDSWYYFSPFCSAQGWPTPCATLKDEFCNGGDGFVPFSPAGNATRCCEYGFFSPLCCQSKVEDDLNDNPGIVISSLAQDGGSIRGPIQYDGRIGVDVLGPGQYVVSAKSDQDTSSLNCGDDAILVLNGTSMSTAVIAGAAVMVREYFLRGFYPSGEEISSNGFTPSANLLKAMLIGSGSLMAVVNSNARQHFEDLQNQPLPNFYSGFGRVQLDQVFKLTGSTRDLRVYDRQRLTDQKTLSSAPIWGYRRCITIGQSVTNVKITLVWSDPPVAPGAGIALRNNLDLAVVNDLQLVYKANSDTAFDAVNPVEQVLCNTLIAVLQISYMKGVDNVFLSLTMFASWFV